MSEIKKSLRRLLPQSELGSINAAPQPCSYCLKTRKKCTLEWATKVNRQGYLRAPAGGTKIPERKYAKSTGSGRNGHLDTLAKKSDDGSLDSSAFPACEGTLYDGPAPASGINLLYPVFSEGSLLGLSPAGHYRSSLPNPPIYPVSPSLPEPSDKSPSDLSEPSAQEYWSVSDRGTEDWDEEHQNDYHLPWEPHYCWSDRVTTKPTQTGSEGDGNSSSELRKRPQGSYEQTPASGYSLSPSLPNQAIANISTQQFISSGLFQIYHDVLENNLTCWLTESTCPYKSREVALSPESLPSLRREWGSLWSNRIHTRTVELDRAAMANGMVRISYGENQAASRALSLAIVAFASQWAQGSRRQWEDYPNNAEPSAIDTDGSESAGSRVTEEFDRKIQRQLWEQARTALQEVSDVECFRVASAEIIFGLTQKPLVDNTKSPGSTEAGGSTCAAGSRSLKSHVLEQLSNLISIEGPPIYMERAARKLQALKSRFDVSIQSFGSNIGEYGMKMAANRLLLSYEHRATIDLLYWLAVMFDTISSSMNNRPVVVSDEESRHHPPPECSHDIDSQSNDTAAAGRWDIGLFIQDNVHQPEKIPVWPCSYEEAADAVVRSAPIKVLLFRHISYLQSMIRNGVRGECIEKLIETTTCVYGYWEMTYGSFFRSLVAAIDFIPFRIQGWFACISAHWHLAALMLGDILDHVDNELLGTPFGTQCRTAMKTSATIRDKTIKDLSDLARISTPRGEGPVNARAFNQENFHHAVNECIILTEPWTLILINAFSKASAILLGAAEESVNDDRGRLAGAGEKLITNLQMAEECIRALWHLGKKSDLSRKSAEILSVALDKLHAFLGAGL